jgi:hypothetical protein
MVVGHLVVDLWELRVERLFVDLHARSFCVSRQTGLLDKVEVTELTRTPVYSNRRAGSEGEVKALRAVGELLLLLVI